MRIFFLTLLCWMSFGVTTFLSAATQVVGNFTLTYSISYNVATITDCSNSSGSLKIPSALGGYPVTSIGNHAFDGCSSLTSVTIPEGVTFIGNRAFSGCTGLTSVTIPSSVTTIGSYAFWGVAPETLTAPWFPGEMSAEKLKTLIIPEGVTEIKGYAFQYCSSLTAVTIPSSVTEIGYRAFNDCTGLTSVTIPEGVTSIGVWAFHDCSSLTSVTIPSSVTSIGEGAFPGCSSLTSVTIPEGVTTIGSDAFSGVSPETLTSSWFPEGMSSSNLKILMIPDGVKSLRDGAFESCSPLKSVLFLGTPPENIKAQPFSSSLIYYPTSSNALLDKWTVALGTLSSWSTATFQPYNRMIDGILYNTKGGVASLVGTYEILPEAVIIPERIQNRYTVTAIALKAFMGQSALTTIEFPKNISTIGTSIFEDCHALRTVTFIGPPPTVEDGAFKDCVGYYWGIYAEDWKSVITEDGSWKNLTMCQLMEDDLFFYEVGENGLTVAKPKGPLSGKIEVPSMVNGLAVVAIAPWAFSEQSAITDIVIQEGITSIGNTAFSGCTSLTSVTIPSSVTFIGDSAFSGVAPETLIAAWLPSGMSTNNFKTLIIPEGVIQIEESAFSDCLSLTSVTIPESVMSIGKDVFSGCTNITDVSLPIRTSCDMPGFYEAYLTNQKSLNLEESLWENNPVIVGEASKLHASTLDSYTTYIYGADMYFEGGVTYYFSADYDDYSSVKVGDCLVIAPAQSECQVGTGNITFETSGWHWIDLRGMNYGGPGAMNSDKNNGFHWWTSIDGTKRRFVVSEGEHIFRITGYCTIEYLFPESYAKILSVKLLDNPTIIPKAFFKGCTCLPQVDLPSSVTSIESSAFFDCSSLNSITIPEGVKSIGTAAFRDCTSLTAVTIPSSVTSIGNDTFYNCSGLISVGLSEGITSIGSSAFRDCTSLTAVTIPSSVTSIGNDTFYNCSGLISVGLSEGITSIGSSAFRGCTNLTSLTIPSSVTSIGGSAFYGCVALSSVEIPDGVKTINTSVFYNCRALTSVIIPKGVTSIESSAFFDCSSLNSITIPEGVKSIGTAAFRDCTSLTAVTIPSSVTSIGNDTFYNCSGLISVGLSEGITSIGSSAFRGCTNLTSLTIPSSVASIGDSAFYGCVALSSVEIPDGVKTINTSVFYNCRALTSVIIPKGVTSIGSSAFWGCSALSLVLIPDGVTSIGSAAFSGCTGLTSVTIPLGVISIGSDAFKDVSPVILTASKLVGGMSGAKLESLTIHQGVTSLPANAFSGCTRLLIVRLPSSLVDVGANAFEGVTPTTLTATEIPEGMEVSALVDLSISEGTIQIPDSAFKGCCEITKLVIPEGVTTIGKMSFSECTKLQDLHLPNSLETLQVQAFYNCEKLKSVTIPASVTFIGEYAFSGCSSLASVYFNGLPPRTTESLFIFDDFGEITSGYYPTTLQSQWESVIEYGWWDNLYMVGKQVFDVTVQVDGRGTVIGSGTYFVGTEITLTAMPNEKSVFCGWSTTPMNGNETLQLTVSGEDLTLTAYFMDASALDVYLQTHESVSQEVIDARVEEVITERGLLTRAELKALAKDSPVVEVKNGVATLKVNLKQAASLEELSSNAVDSPQQLNIKVPDDEKVLLYKVVKPSKE